MLEVIEDGRPLSDAVAEAILYISDPKVFKKAHRDSHINAMEILGEVLRELRHKEDENMRRQHTRQQRLAKRRRQRKATAKKMLPW